jgi:hypothetical protein
MQVIMSGLIIAILSFLTTSALLAINFLMVFISAMVGALFITTAVDFLEQSTKEMIPIEMLDLVYWDVVWICFILRVALGGVKIPDVKMQKI